ncbi:hypothetical protein Tco_0488668 [Tanacetum coccineum]
MEGFSIRKTPVIALSAYADGDLQVVKTHEDVRQDSSWFLGDKLVSCQRVTESTMTSTRTEAEYISMSGCLPLLSAAIMSSTPGPSTLTYDTILFESKLRRAWLNCTL